MRVAIQPPKERGKYSLQHKSFVMIGMMRSGSNFLERELNLLGDVRCHGELFNPHFVGLSHDYPQGLEGYTREDIQSRNKDPIGMLNKLNAVSDRPIWGFRIFLDHSPPVTSEVLYDPTVRKIVLTRNLLEAYVSLINARETGVWLTTDQQKVKPSVAEVNVDELVSFALRQTFYYNDILTILHRTGQDYMQIDYTEIKDLARLNELAEFVGSAHRFEKVEEPIKKQATDSMDKRIQDYPTVAAELRKRQLARWLIA
jgi:LPS sulfotransferase NodH